MGRSFHRNQGYKTRIIQNHRCRWQWGAEFLEYWALAQVLSLIQATWWCQLVSLIKQGFFYQLIDYIKGSFSIWQHHLFRIAYTVFHQDNYTSHILVLNIRAQPTRLAREGVWIPALVVIRSFWFGSNLPTGQEGGELQWSLRCEAWSVLSCTPL